MGQLDLDKVLDSLHDKKVIRPVIIAGVDAFDRLQTYGVAGYKDYRGNGGSAEKYASFLENELIPFVRKKSGVRKFNSVTIAGFSLGGLSALDFGWDHGDKVNKVGVFSGSFWLRDKDASDPDYSDAKNRIVLSKLTSSRKRPKITYWIYAGGKEENADRDKDGIIDVIDDSKDVIQLLETKSPSMPNEVTYVEDRNGTHDYSSWRHVFPQFLVWAVGKK